MKAPAECETWTYWWIVKWSGPQPLASIWVWSWDPLRFVRRHPPHHLSPAEQTTRQGVILWGVSAAPQPAQQRSDQGRKPVISAQSRWRGQFRTSISRFESSRPSPPFVRSAGFARKRQNGPEIAAFRDFILSPDSRFA